MTPEEKAVEIIPRGLGQSILLNPAYAEEIRDEVAAAIREAYEDAARIAEEEQRRCDRECVVMGKTDCYNEASRYAARAAGAGDIAAAIREKAK